MHHHTNRIAGALALLVTLAVTAHAASPFGPNLMPNPGFEETEPGDLPLDWKLNLDKPDAATMSTVETDAVAGKRALSLELAEPDLRGQQIGLQSPIIPCQPGWYLVSLSYRHEFTGEKLHDRRFDVERLSDAAAGTREDLIYHYYNERPPVSGQWDRTFFVARVLPGQDGIRLQFAYFGPNETRFLLDAVSVRKIDAATLSSPAIEEPSILKGGLAAEPIDDPDASDGRAYRCEEGQHEAGNKIIWNSQTILSPGLYRLRFRLRQEQATTTEDTQSPIILNASGDNGGAADYVMTADFKGTTDYEEFDLVFFYPFGEGHCINWRYPGSGIYRFDQISAEKVADVSMKEAWDVLAEGVEPE